MNIIDGKAVSASVKEQIRAEIERDGLEIGLAVIIVGNNQASRVYVNNKRRRARYAVSSHTNMHSPKKQLRNSCLSLSIR